MDMQAGIIDGWLLLMAVWKTPQLNSYEDAVVFADTGRFKLSYKTRAEKRVMVSRAKELREEGLMLKDISEVMGVNLSTVKYWHSIKWEAYI